MALNATTLNDLRTHVKEKHALEYARLEKDFFTESNAYWMVIYPEDYRRIVTKVTKNGSRLAVEARKLVTDESPMYVCLDEPFPG